MSYDLMVWKRAPGAKAATDDDVYASFCEDEPHPSATRFDMPAFEADVRDAFGDPDDDPDEAVLYEKADFTGQPANWVSFNLAYSQVETVLPKLVELASRHGLTVYDPQADD